MGAKPKLKICFLSLVHAYDDTRILHKEARALADQGWEVVHLAPGHEAAPERLNGVRIEIYPRNRGFLGRLTRFPRAFRRARKIAADFYHCNEVDSWILGLLLKLARPGTKVIFDVHEHYPSRFNEPHIPKWLGWIGGPAMRGLFRVGPRWTDHIVLAKRTLAPDFERYADKTSLIMNYGPLWMKSRRIEDIEPAVRKEFEGRRVAVHIGGFSRVRGWPQLLRALALMRNQDLEIFCFGSVTEGEDALREEARRLGVLPRIQLRRRVPYQKLFDYLLCAQVGLMLYQPGIQNHVYAFPMKMYDYMLVGLPVIGPDFAVEVEPVIREEKCGLTLNTSDPQQIAEALDWVCDHPDQAREMGQRGREAILTRYNWETQAEKLIRIYENLVENSMSMSPDNV